MTLSISYGEQLEAALECIDGLRLVVTQVQEHTRAITRCLSLKVVRIHFLDQEGLAIVNKGSEAQAGFQYHTDKAKEFANLGKAHNYALSADREISVLFTVVLRIGGIQPSALQVLGFSSAEMPLTGSAHLFPSRLEHRTSTLGGLKVALFLGWSHALVSDEKLSRYQDII